jgi:hypothetical protein
LPSQCDSNAIKEKKVNNNSNDNINIDSSLKEEKEIEKNWKTDFAIYQDECRTAFDKFVNSKEWMQLRERDNPGVDIEKTLIKACTEFWVTEAGWKHKKKSKIKDIDWSATFINAINLKSNRIYKPK